MPIIRCVKRRLLPFAASFAVTCVFFINVCDLIFDCGCRSLWAGADAFCNVHQAGTRHCPFCARGVPGYAAIMAMVTAPQLAASLWLPWRSGARTVACLLVFPAAMLAVGLAVGVYDGYW